MVSLNEEVIRKVIAEVLAEMVPSPEAGKKAESPSSPKAASSMKLAEKGAAGKSSDPRDVVIGISPGFGVGFNETIVGTPHSEVLRQLMAGIEEEGMKPRVVRVLHTCDVAFIGKKAAEPSGSGVAVGVLSRGTAVIHHKDLPPLGNLELFPQSPLLDPETFRAIGRNAAKYAKGENPVPVPTKNDPMARPRYQGLAALLHNKEMRFVDPKKDPVEIEVVFER